MRKGSRKLGRRVSKVIPRAKRGQSCGIQYLRIIPHRPLFRRGKMGTTNTFLQQQLARKPTRILQDAWRSVVTCACRSQDCLKYTCELLACCFICAKTMQQRMPHAENPLHSQKTSFDGLEPCESTDIPMRIGDDITCITTHPVARRHHDVLAALWVAQHGHANLPGLGEVLEDQIAT